MVSFQESMNEYRRQLEKGAIKKAYGGLMDYFDDLRLHFEKKYPDYFVSGSVYQGRMDMTYFSFFTRSLKLRKLKVAIVFVHDAFRFEVWLAGVNKQTQAKYWKLFKDNGWNKYRVPATTKGVDSIVEGILAENPAFDDLEALTAQIENGAFKFIEEVKNFLSKHENGDKNGRSNQIAFRHRQ